MKQILRVTIPRRHPGVSLAKCFLCAAALLRLAYYLPKRAEALLFWVHLCLPVAAAAALLAGLALGGPWAKRGALAGLVLGVAFFLIKAATFTPVHRALCTVLYLTVLLLFSATLLGYLPTKKLLYPLFGLPLVYHILVEDTGKYFFADPPVPVWDWLPEISVLCIMAGLLSLSIALETEKIGNQGMRHEGSKAEHGA